MPPARSPARDAAMSSMMGMMVFGASALTGIAVVSLMLDTTDQLQDQARVATEATSDSLLPVVQVRGLAAHRLGGEGPLERLTVLVAPAPGTLGVALDRTAVQLVTADGRVSFQWGAGPRDFTAAALLDVDPAFDPGKPFVSRGDLVEIELPLREAGSALEPRAEGSLTFLAPDARPERVPFRVPGALLGRDYIELQSEEPDGPQGWTFGRLDDP